MYCVILRLHDIKKLHCALNTPWKYILLIYFTFLVKVLPAPFHYSLGISIFCYTFYQVKIDSMISSSTQVTRKNVLFPLLGIYLLLRNQEHLQKNIGIKVSALPTSWPLFTAMVLPVLWQIYQIRSYSSHSLRGGITS